MWHPEATALHDLHQAGKLTVMPTIGYTDPDQSHFTSRHYWEVGELDPNERTGWLGRLIDVIGVDDNPIQGLSLDGWLLPSLASGVEAGGGDRRLDLRPLGAWRLGARRRDHVRARAGDGADGRRPAQTWAASSPGAPPTSRSSLRGTLEDFGEVTVPAVYPDADHWFCQNMSALSAMLDADLPIRCVSVSAPGSYDTHDNQAETFGDDIGITFDTLAAFQADLEARGLADRVITLVYSEFGRRPEQNAHGHRPRRGRRRVRHGHAGPGRDGRRVAGPWRRRARRGRQLDPHRRLPVALLLDPRAVVRRRRRSDHSRRVWLRAPSDHRAMNAGAHGGGARGGAVPCSRAGRLPARRPRATGQRRSAFGTESSERSFSLTRTKVQARPGAHPVHEHRRGPSRREGQAQGVRRQVGDRRAQSRQAWERSRDAR